MNTTPLEVGEILFKDRKRSPLDTRIFGQERTLILCQLHRPHVKFQRLFGLQKQWIWRDVAAVEV
jgi:hypothetical protein